MPRHTRYHIGEDTPDSMSLPLDGVKRVFARRLQDKLVEKGWNQSDLTRELAKHLSSPPHRSLVSNYIRMKSLPSPEALAAIAKCLGVAPQDLLPTNRETGAAMANDAASADLRDLGDGKVWLRINQALTWSTALKVLELLKGEQDGQVKA